VNHLCIGSANFDQRYGIKNISNISSEDIEKIIIHCFNNSIYYIDTAPTYGNAQLKIGNILTEHSLNQKARCISKINHNIDLNDFESMEKSIRSSLDQLQVTSLWGLLLHRTPEEISEKFKDFIFFLKKENYIKNFGISIYEPSDALFFAEKDFIDIIQVPFNCLDRRLIDNNFFEICYKNNITPMIRSIYLQGALLMSESEILSSNLKWANNELGIFRSFCDENHLNRAAMCLQSVNNYIDNSIIIIGVNSLDEYSKNFNSFTKSNKYSIFEKWWDNLSIHSNKLLNPSEW
jgi:aryl-alcohol dehydrogenase-like predicted oxidoreductase